MSDNGETPDQPASSAISAPAPERLPEAARPVWRAYQALCESKRLYHDLFVREEEKRKQGLATDPRDRLRLEILLGRHGECVTAFRRTLAGLQAQEPAAHADFLRLLKDESDVLTTSR